MAYLRRKSDLKRWPSLFFRSVFSVVFSMVFSVVFVACADQNEIDDGVAGDGEEVGAAAELQGNWNSVCHDSGHIGLGLTEKSTLEVRGTKFTRRSNVSSRGSCSELSVRVVQSGSYRAGGAVRNGIRMIDVQIERISVTPMSETGMAILKLYNFCGVSSWSIGGSVDVTGRSGGDRCFTRLPLSTVNIYALENDRLFFGNYWDLSAPRRRPQQLERDYYYSR